MNEISSAVRFSHFTIRSIMCKVSPEYHPENFDNWIVELDLICGNINNNDHWIATLGLESMLWLSIGAFLSNFSDIFGRKTV